MRMLLIIFMCFVLGTPFVADAQFLNSIGGQPEIKTTPAFPEPNQEVEASLDAYAFDTDGAVIQWFLDGVEIADAQNTRSATFVVGELGSASTISAQIALPNGQVLTANKEIVPARVDIVIEAETTTPLHYEGRALPSSGSAIRAVAIAHLDGSRNNLSYKWRLDNTVLEGGTLIGNNVITFKAPMSGRPVLGVEVKNADGTTVAKKNIFLPIQEPEMYFYESNPLRGLSHYAITDPRQLIGEEITVRAEPYYMASSIFSTDPHMEWEINGRTLENPSDDPQLITLRSDGGAGSFNVSFHLRNMQELLQGIEEEFTITF